MSAGRGSRALARWSLPLVWLAVIYVLSTDTLSFPEARRTWAGFLAAKGVHVLEYGVLALAWYRALAGGLRRWRVVPAIGSIGAAILTAIADEVRQSSTVYRRGTVEDVLLDTAAAAAAVAVLALWFVCASGKQERAVEIAR